MPKIELDRLSDDSAIWVFGIAPPLDERGAAVLLKNVDAFLDQWTAHNVPVASGRELREGRFLVIAAETTSETSGCSIDKLFGLVRGLEKQLGISMLDPNMIFFRDDNGRIASASRSEFRDGCNADTIVFDVTAQRLHDLRSGVWERPARDSWHRQLLAITA